MPDREKIISDFEHEVFKANSEGWDFVDLSTEDAKEILALLKEQEIVLCKDCMYYNSEPDSHVDHCNKIHWSRGLDWFCADGKRR